MEVWQGARDRTSFYPNQARHSLALQDSGMPAWPQFPSNVGPMREQPGRSQVPHPQRLAPGIYAKQKGTADQTLRNGLKKLEMQRGLGSSSFCTFLSSLAEAVSGGCDAQAIGGSRWISPSEFPALHVPLPRETGSHRRAKPSDACNSLTNACLN